MKLLIPIIFIGIIASLGSALFFMMKDKGASSNMVRSLTFRIGLSVMLFILVWVAHYFGYIQSTGIQISN